MSNIQDMSLQTFYDKCCWSLRTFGNPYGTTSQRGWGWEGLEGEKCAISRFMNHSERIEYFDHFYTFTTDPIIQKRRELMRGVINLFDSHPEICNNSIKLEAFLQDLAIKNNLIYTDPLVACNDLNKEISNKEVETI